jgi:hypothetical protein
LVELRGFIGYGNVFSADVIRILREPSPIVFGAVHLAMSEVFDMDEIFKHLVLQGTTTVKKNCPSSSLNTEIN